MDQKQVIHVMNAATTVSGAAAAGSVTSNQDLKRKTAIGVIERGGKRKILSLYRQSSAVPGQYSRDVYVLEKRKWKWIRKDKRKYPQPPYAPVEAYKYSDGPYEVWTLRPMKSAEKKRLRQLFIQIQ